MSDAREVFRPEANKIRRQFTIFALMGFVGTPVLLLLGGVNDWGFTIIVAIVAAAVTVGICALVFLLPTPRYVEVRGDSLQLARRILPDSEVSLPDIEKVELYLPQNSVRLFKHEENHFVADMTLRLSYFGESDKKRLLYGDRVMMSGARITRITDSRRRAVPAGRLYYPCIPT